MAIKVALFFTLAVLAGQSLACCSTALNIVGSGSCGLGSFNGCNNGFGSINYGIGGCNAGLCGLGGCNAGLYGLGGCSGLGPYNGLGLNSFGTGCGNNFYGLNGYGCGNNFYGLNGYGCGLNSLNCATVIQPAKTCVTKCCSTPVLTQVCNGC